MPNISKVVQQIYAITIKNQNICHYIQKIYRLKLSKKPVKG